MGFLGLKMGFFPYIGLKTPFIWIQSNPIDLNPQLNQSINPIRLNQSQYNPIESINQYNSIESISIQVNWINQSIQSDWINQSKSIWMLWIQLNQSNVLSFNRFQSCNSIQLNLINTVHSIGLIAYNDWFIFKSNRVTMTYIHKKRHHKLTDFGTRPKKSRPVFSRNEILNLNFYDWSDENEG